MSGNRNIFTKQQKKCFIECSVLEMERNVPLIETKSELKVKSWLYKVDKGVKKRNDFLVLQKDDGSVYHLFCVYCVCFASDLKSRLSNKGIQIKEATNVRRTINDHIDSNAHQKCENEYLKPEEEIVVCENPFSSEYERIQNNRFIANEVLETLVHLITSSEYYQISLKFMFYSLYTEKKNFTS